MPGRIRAKTAEKPTCRKAGVYRFYFAKSTCKICLGKTVDIKIDRPAGSIHPKYPDLTYPVNYGYIPGVFGGDGEELDVYLLGVDVPVEEYTARIIGIVHRHDDVEDKLVAARKDFILIGILLQRRFTFRNSILKVKLRYTNLPVSLNKPDRIRHTIQEHINREEVQ